MTPGIEHLDLDKGNGFASMCSMLMCILSGVPINMRKRLTCAFCFVEHTKS